MKLPLELLVSLEVKQFNSKHTVQQLLLKESARNEVRSKSAAASNADTIRKLACSKWYIKTKPRVGRRDIAEPAYFLVLTFLCSA